MANPTVNSYLNDKALRADFPKMRDDAYEHAVRLAAYVGRALEGGDQKQFYLSFLALRKVLPRNLMMNLTMVGPKLHDFMDVITEVSGLAVVHTNSGLWFFDMQSRVARTGGYPTREIAKHYATVTGETPLASFHGEEPEDDGE